MVLDGDLALSHHYIVVEHIENKDIDAFLIGVAESLVLGNELLVSRKILCRRLGFGNIAVESFDIRSLVVGVIIPFSIAVMRLLIAVPL